MNVVECDTVIELGFFLVGEMSKAIPLAAGLRVELPDVVVDYTGWFLVDVFVEDLTAEENEVFLGV
jgi:hypothetical protein